MKKDRIILRGDDNITRKGRDVMGGASQTMETLKKGFVIDAPTLICYTGAQRWNDVLSVIDVDGNGGN